MLNTNIYCNGNNSCANTMIDCGYSNTSCNIDCFNPILNNYHTCLNSQIYHESTNFMLDCGNSSNTCINTTVACENNLSNDCKLTYDNINYDWYCQGTQNTNYNHSCFDSSITSAPTTLSPTTLTPTAQNPTSLAPTTPAPTMIYCYNYTFIINLYLQPSNTINSSSNVVIQSMQVSVYFFYFFFIFFFLYFFFEI